MFSWRMVSLPQKHPKLRPWSELSLSRNSDHGLSFSCPWQIQSLGWSGFWSEFFSDHGLSFLPQGQKTLGYAGRHRFGSVRLRFGGGTVRAVPVFGSCGSSTKRVFEVSVQFNRKGRFRFLKNGSGGSGSTFGFWKNGSDGSGFRFRFGS